MGGETPRQRSECTVHGSDGDRVQDGCSDGAPIKAACVPGPTVPSLRPYAPPGQAAGPRTPQQPRMHAVVHRHTRGRRCCHPSATPPPKAAASGATSGGWQLAAAAPRVPIRRWLQNTHCRHSCRSQGVRSLAPNPPTFSNGEPQRLRRCAPCLEAAYFNRWASASAGAARRSCRRRHGSRHHRGTGRLRAPYRVRSPCPCCRRCPAHGYPCHTRSPYLPCRHRQCRYPCPSCRRCRSVLPPPSHQHTAPPLTGGPPTTQEAPPWTGPSQRHKPQLSSRGPAVTAAAAALAVTRGCIPYGW